MGCEGCPQNQRAYDSVKEKAQQIANETGQWVGVYKEGSEYVYAIGEQCTGKPIEFRYTPEKNLQQHTI